MKDFGMEKHIVPILAPVSVEATTVMPHVALKKYERVKFLISLGVCSGDTHVLTVTASAATAGSSSTALYFKYRVTAAAGTDTLGDLVGTAVSSLALTYTTYAGKTVIIEVDADELTEDKPYVGITITDPGSAVALMSIVAELKPRHPQATKHGAPT